MCILFIRLAVRGPTGMRNALVPVKLAVYRVRDDGDLARGTPTLQRVCIVDYSNAGGIVTTVFQAPESLDKDGDNVTLGNGPNNATH